MIFGFDEVENNLINTFKNNKLHHCNILLGTEGIGKSKFLIENIIPNILYVGSNTNELISSGGHTDFLRLDINSLDEDGKENTSKKGEININQTRKIINDLRMTPSISKYKVLLVDSIDIVNINGQNALLKTLEEPTKNTYIFLVCHNLNKVLKTIISRSNLIKVPVLSIENWYRAVFSNEDVQTLELNDEDVDNLYQLSNFSVSSALKFLRTNSLNMYSDILDIILKHNAIEIQKFIDDVFDNDKYDVFCNSLNKVFSDLIYNKSNNEVIYKILKKISIKNIINYYDYFISINNDINIYNLDKKLTFNVFFNNFI